MKQLIIVLSFVLGVYLFTILTSQDRSVYNGTSLSMDNIPAYSYEDASKVAESL